MANSGARILIRGGRVYDHDGDVHQPAQADILIAGERIEKVAPNLTAEAGVEMIDATGKLVVPGLVNAHYHSHDVMAKGLFEEMPFDVWTLHSNPANYGTRSLKEVRLRTLVGAIESLRNGITTIQDFLTVVPQGYNAQNGNREWEESVRNNGRIATSSHAIAAAGYHTLKIWMIDPAVVLEKIVVSSSDAPLGPSYLGPPESVRGE